MGRMRVKGIERLKAKARRMPDEVKREVEKAIEKGADELVERMVRGVPIDDGVLRDSIQKERIPEAEGTAYRVHAGAGKAYYARFVEFGTSDGKPAQPFFYPSYRMLRSRIRGRISRATTKAVKRVAGNGQ